MAEATFEGVKAETEAMGFNFNKVLAVITAGMAVIRTPEGEAFFAALKDLFASETPPAPVPPVV